MFLIRSFTYIHIDSYSPFNNIIIKLSKMKNKHLLSLLFTLMIGYSFLSCKKQFTPPVAKNIEWKIAPMSNSIIGIMLTSNAGFPTFLFPSQMPGGSYTFSKSYFPYLTRISTKVYNPTNSIISYNLIILVDGQVKNTVSVTVPAMTDSSWVGSAEYTVY